MTTRIVEVVLKGVPLEVMFNHHKAYKGHRNIYGAPEEEDEPASIEIEDVCAGSISIMDMLTGNQIDDILELVKEAA
jgi:hypothetical protein